MNEVTKCDLKREDIIRMAKEAAAWDLIDHDGITALERFAALVAEREREACVELCEEQMKSYMSKRYTTDPLGGFRERFAAEQCAIAIRARGEA